MLGVLVFCQMAQAQSGPVRHNEDAFADLKLGVGE